MLFYTLSLGLFVIIFVTLIVKLGKKLKNLENSGFSNGHFLPKSQKTGSEKVICKSKTNEISGPANNIHVIINSYIITMKDIIICVIIVCAAIIFDNTTILFGLGYLLKYFTFNNSQSK